jgi:signal transduction histidine kinase
MTNPYDFTLDTLEDERRYVAQELHDNIAQSTLQLGLQIGICHKLMERGNIELLATELAKLEQNIQQSSFEVREMIADMRPPKVDPMENLETYFQYFIELHQARGGPPLTYRMNIRPDSLTLSPRQTLAITRILQEALQNIRKHTEAKNAWVYAAENENAFWVSIADDGRGFDLTKARGEEADQGGGAGIANMQARAQAIGGALTITKGPNGQGTKVTVTWPK